MFTRSECKLLEKKKELSAKLKQKFKEKLRIERNFELSSLILSTKSNFLIFFNVFSIFSHPAPKTI